MCVAAAPPSDAGCVDLQLRPSMDASVEGWSGVVCLSSDVESPCGLRVWLCTDMEWNVCNQKKTAKVHVCALHFRGLPVNSHLSCPFESILSVDTQ